MEGTCISDTFSSNGTTLAIKGSARYFVAARTTGIRSSERIKSGWKLFNETGVPKTVTTGTDEPLSVQAHRLSRNPGNTDNAIGIFRFSFVSPSGKNLVLKKNSDTLLYIATLSSIPQNESTKQFNTLSEFIQNSDTDLKHAVIKNNQNQFTIFTLFSSIGENDSLTYSIKNNTDNKILFEGNISLTANPGLEDINTTTGLPPCGRA